MLNAGRPSRNATSLRRHISKFSGTQRMEKISLAKTGRLSLHVCVPIDVRRTGYSAMVAVGVAAPTFQDC